MKFILALLLTLSSAYAQVTGTSGNFMPIGAVMAFALTSCPAGWVMADGASVLKTKYPRLTASMGAIHGNGTTNATGAVADTGCPHATNCLNLPDYRGRFLRMIDGTAGTDVDKTSRTAMNVGGVVGNAVGSVQSDAIRNIQGTWSLPDVNPIRGGETLTGPFYNAGGSSPFRAGYDSGGGNAMGFDASRTVPTGSDNRPKNAYIIYCVKY